MSCATSASIIRQTAVILITAYASVETAVEAMKMGAYDYVTKPFKIDELQMTVQRRSDYQAASAGERLISARSSRINTNLRTSSERAEKCSSFIA